MFLHNENPSKNDTKYFINFPLHESFFTLRQKENNVKLKFWWHFESFMIFDHSIKTDMNNSIYHANLHWKHHSDSSCTTGTNLWLILPTVRKTAYLKILRENMMIIIIIEPWTINSWIKFSIKFWKKNRQCSERATSLSSMCISSVCVELQRISIQNGAEQWSSWRENIRNLN